MHPFIEIRISVCSSFYNEVLDLFAFGIMFSSFLITTSFRPFCSKGFLCLSIQITFRGFQSEIQIKLLIREFVAIGIVCPYYPEPDVKHSDPAFKKSPTFQKNSPPPPILVSGMRTVYLRKLDKVFNGNFLADYLKKAGSDNIQKTDTKMRTTLIRLQLI